MAEIAFSHETGGTRAPVGSGGAPNRVVLNHFVRSSTPDQFVYHDGVFPATITGDVLHEKMMLFGAATGVYYRVLTDLGRQSVDPFQQIVQIEPNLVTDDAAAGVWLFPPAVKISGNAIIFTNQLPYITGQ